MNYSFCWQNNIKDKKRDINTHAYMYIKKKYLRSHRRKKKSWLFEAVVGKRWKKSIHTHLKLQVEILDKKKLIIQAGAGPGHCLFLYYTTLSCLNMLIANWVTGHKAEHNFPLREGTSQHSPLQVTLVLLSWDIMLLNEIFLGPC